MLSTQSELWRDKVRGKPPATIPEPQQSIKNVIGKEVLPKGMGSSYIKEIIFFHQSGSRMFRSFFAGHQAETREEGLLFQSLVYYRSPSSITEPGSYLGLNGHLSPR